MANEQVISIKSHLSKSHQETYYETFINYVCSFTYPYTIYAKSLDVYHRYLSSNKDANISQITKHIYAGNLSAAYNSTMLKENNIEYIVTAVWNMPRINEFIYTRQIDIIDVPQKNIVQYFEQCNQFLDNVIKSQKNVLIHCICGVSRSITLIIAYFIYKFRISPKIALDYIQTKRPIANPNEGFMKQLEIYYEQLQRDNDDKKEIRMDLSYEDYSSFFHDL